MKKSKVEKGSNGFSVKKSDEYSKKIDREQRMKERKENKSKNITNEMIFDFLQDLADRQSEIYDMLKEK